MISLELRIPPLPQFITVGHAIWKPGDCHFKRSFNVYDVVFVKEGALYLSEDESEYEVVSGQMLVLEPGRTHHGYRRCEVNTEVYWVHFIHEMPLRSLSASEIEWSRQLVKGTIRDLVPMEQFMYLPKYSAVEGLNLYPILDEMCDIFQSNGLAQALPLHILLSQLFYELQKLLRERPRARSIILCERMLDYLRRNAMNEFRANHLEEELHYHFDYLSRCFRKHTGMSPLQYVHQIKLEKAKSLLEQTDLPIQVVGEQSGLPDTNYFIRLFKQKVGMTPRKYRNTKRDQCLKV
ncbi:AraC family transcriptional regulator [Paenibacillus sp. FSL H8-0548]|uniref:helix-turn-helix transcriptional regulator n=1 Tax=Paenibacillus sp. FSL H8-0548 TaxID=1920422 RepID=UPI00096D1B06|nr:AraC family transcriptional regulator [Paenibacillus sp. FSL H8-0548]OMF35959.1 AraC family transcriptional regulator [Paenibacillus sp. FSL H8-0548]